ncbi:DEKNAAC105324 [Brettanomyces naardenensis]|uniref:DEKNAAC105324 n=1 Tax=Brettanomyces naardenensis TaxID=13370 RepID=A0A448YTC1_BRENA|nr:DEKNAAC105324 [Brettanomyces naardenensis]
MESHRPVALNVGYYDPFLVFKNTLGPLFQKKIRINTLHWKFQPTDSVHTINNVQLHYIEDDNNSVDHLHREFLKFIFVSCSNIDEYRAKVRPVIRQWLNNVKSLKPIPMYYIILYEDASLRTAADKFLKTSLLTKIRTDFADDELTIDNAFKIKSSYTDVATENEIWESILTAIRLGITDSISNTLRYYESLKPPLLMLRKSADFYQTIGQLDDALRCYSRLLGRIGNIGKGDGFEETVELSTGQSVGSDSKFQQKLYVYQKQKELLLDESSSDGVYMKNLILLATSLLSLLNSIYDCHKKQEFSIVRIEELFADERLGDLLDKAENVPEQLYECLGDLKLTERDELVKLGSTKGYIMKGSMVEIYEEQEEQHYETHDPNLLKILKSDESFKDSVLEIAEECIKLYSQSPYKANTVDTLSTEVALMIYYSLHDYETSLEVLNNSFQYYKGTGWNGIALDLLKVYIENLEKLKEKNGPDVVLQLLVSYLEMVSMGQKFDNHRLEALLKGLSEPIVVENDSLFDISVDPYLGCEKPDVYFVTLHLKSKLVGVEVDSIAITLEGETLLEFSLGKCTLERDNTLKLETRNVSMGDFKATRLSIKMKNLELVGHLSDTVRLFQIDSFVSDEVVHNVMLDVMVPPTRYLNKDELLLVANVGDRTLSNFSFEFRKTETDRLVPDAKFRMLVDDKQIAFDVKDSDEKMVFKATNTQVDSRSIVRLYIPYFFPPDVSETKLFIDFRFNFDGFSKRIVKKLNTMLAIAVSVQDIFKSSKLFSNYTINSVLVDNPVRIQRVYLSAPKKESHTSIETWLSPKNIIAYIDQGSTFFYKLENLKDQSLELSIEYNDLHSEIVEILKQEYYKETDRSLLKYFNLVVTCIFGKLAFKLNLYGLTGKVELLDYDISTFTESLKLVDLKDLPRLTKSIDESVKKLGNTAWDIDEKILEKTRKRLVISVSLPVVNIVDIVEFKFEKRLQYLVCEPIKMRLSFDIFVLQLQAGEEKKVRFEADPSRPKQITLRLGFSDYEQNWLIGGLKDFTVQLRLDEKANTAKKILDCELTLIPLRVGKLELPKVEIRNLTEYKVEMEMDYKNSCECLLVVSELNKVVHSF